MTEGGASFSRRGKLCNQQEKRRLGLNATSPVTQTLVILPKMTNLEEKKRMTSLKRYLMEGSSQVE